MNPTTYHRHELLAYLKAYHYTLTYRQGQNDAYYFGLKRTYVFVPFHQLVFSEEDVLNVFETGAAHSKAVEYARFEVFVHQFRHSNQS